MSVDYDQTLEFVATVRLLSLGFAPPEESTLTDIESLARGLLDREGAPPELATLLELDWGSLAAEYNALFGDGTPISPYEGSYYADPFRTTRELAKIAAFYRAFGADMSGARGDNPDHVANELAFLAFLGAKCLPSEEGETEEDCEIYRGAQDAFLAEHLGRWFPGFCRTVAQSKSRFYAALAQLGERFVAAELERRHLKPAPLPLATASAYERTPLPSQD